MAQNPPRLPLGPRGVNALDRRVNPREALCYLRRQLWDNIIDRRAPERVDNECNFLLECVLQNDYLAGELIAKWNWSLQTDPLVQCEIFRWRLDWMKDWKSPPYGVGRDTALLPAAWNRIAWVLNEGTYPVDKLAPHAASIINLDPDIVCSGEVWKNLSQLGSQDPIDARSCSVIRKYTSNKASRLRTPRSRKIQHPAWAAPRMDTADPLRFLPSRRPESHPVYKETLLTPFAQTWKGRYMPSGIRKPTFPTQAEISRV
ncbi:hypothetical protein CONLIGDRAFT_691755 [Coniochaeta ligniaria NRRL 30616]|uniref:Uncharacterized protein n=1 Tax=Coniochaeta ligniaria NRRL 30616 TaxID=1408157 RepID=A0A1J7ITK2_9PEZI|nr:hypothetical protein CONLIGDRAFT_691755 [Coniochaeta ligniaria NRRL 30616]